jgi:hypothetical protein
MPRVRISHRPPINNLRRLKEIQKPVRNSGFFVVFISDIMFFLTYKLNLLYFLFLEVMLIRQTENKRSAV